MVLTLEHASHALQEPGLSEAPSSRPAPPPQTQVRLSGAQTERGLHAACPSPQLLGPVLAWRAPGNRPLSEQLHPSPPPADLSEALAGPSLALPSDPLPKGGAHMCPPAPWPTLRGAKPAGGGRSLPQRPGPNPSGTLTFT